MACLSCRHKKVRCDSMRPSCSYCMRRGILCRYENSHVEAQKRAQPSQSPVTGDRNVRARHQSPYGIRQQEHANLSTQVRVPDTSRNFGQGQGGSSVVISGPDHVSERNVAIPPYTPDREAPQVIYADGEALGVARTASGIDNMLDDLLRPVSCDDFTFPTSSSTERVSTCFDSGPAAGFSVLRLSELKFASGAASFLRNSGLHEEMTGCESTVARIQQSLHELARAPISHHSDSPAQDPASDAPLDGNVSKYIDTFFDSCQVTFPVVRRQPFEEAWRTNPPYTSHVDVSWSFLCYSILALGAFSSNPADFHVAKGEGMKFFGAALGLQGPLFRCRPTLMAVQGFLVMTMFAQMIGSPELVYRCSTHAVHTANYVRLHKGNNDRTSAAAPSMQDHQRVFWIAYIFDKCYSLQIGIASAIDDAEVTQPFPSGTAGDMHGLSEVTMGQLRSRAQLSTIYSSIWRRLYSSSSLHATTPSLLAARDDLCRSLALWIDQVPAMFQLRQHPFQSRALPSHVKPVTPLILRVMYHNAVLSIHRRFSSYYEASPEESFDPQVVEASDRKCLRAAREMILLLDRIETGIDVPYWFLTYHLVISVVLVFYSVVRSPREDSVKEDIALIHIATGAFGRLKYSTSGQIAISGVAELPQLAERIVAQAKTRQTGEDVETPSRRGTNVARGVSLDAQVLSVPLACTPICPSKMHFSPGDLTGLFDTPSMLETGWDPDDLFYH